MIDKIESKKRKEAWENAKASCMLENLTIPEENEGFMQKYIDGEITAEELEDLVMKDAFDYAHKFI